MFNTLLYTKKLMEVGLSREQAETYVEIMSEIIQADLATKNDMRDMRSYVKDIELSLRSEMKDLGSKVDHEFALVRSEMRELEHRMTIKLGSIMVIGLGLFASLVKFF